MDGKRTNCSSYLGLFCGQIKLVGTAIVQLNNSLMNLLKLHKLNKIIK